MQRFFLTGISLAPGAEVDLTPLAHQLYSVLRMRPGAQILLLDGRGYGCITEIHSLSRQAGTGKVLHRRPWPGEPALKLHLYQCSLKLDKFEWVLQKGTELGVSRFVPVICRRSVARPGNAARPRLERWRRIVQEAAEQAGRVQLPVVNEPVHLTQALATSHALRLVPWEEAQGAGCPSLGRALDAAPGGVDDIGLLIGPEGGLAVEEVAAAQAEGWQVVSLGSRTLRAETAALASSAVIMERCGELG